MHKLFFFYLIIFPLVIFGQFDNESIFIDAAANRWHIDGIARINSFHVKKQPVIEDSVELSVFMGADYYHFSTKFLDSLRERGKYITDNNIEIQQLLKTKKVLIPPILKSTKPLINSLDSDAKSIGFQLNLPIDTFLQAIEEFKVAKDNPIVLCTEDLKELEWEYKVPQGYCLTIDNPSNTGRYFFIDSLKRIYLSETPEPINNELALFDYLKNKSFYVKGREYWTSNNNGELSINKTGIFYGGKKVHDIASIVYLSSYITIIKTPEYTDEVHGPIFFEYIVNSRLNIIGDKQISYHYSLRY